MLLPGVFFDDDGEETENKDSASITAVGGNLLGKGVVMLSEYNVGEVVWVRLNVMSHILIKNKGITAYSNDLCYIASNDIMFC